MIIIFLFNTILARFLEILLFYRFFTRTLIEYSRNVCTVLNLRIWCRSIILFFVFLCRWCHYFERLVKDSFVLSWFRSGRLIIVISSSILQSYYLRATAKFLCHRTLGASLHFLRVDNSTTLILLLWGFLLSYSLRGYHEALKCGCCSRILYIRERFGLIYLTVVIVIVGVIRRALANLDLS